MHYFSFRCICVVILGHLVYIYSPFIVCVLKVLLTTPTTPTARMKAIVEASEGFVYLVRFVTILPPPPSHPNHSIILLSTDQKLTVSYFEYQVSSVGVTGARASVSEKVETLLREIKKVCLIKAIHLKHCAFIDKNVPSHSIFW